MDTVNVFGSAFKAYLEGDEDAQIEVSINGEADDPIDVAHFFRAYEDMPFLEQYAMNMCEGKIADLGAAAGCHALHLQQMGHEVWAVEQDKAACEVMRKRGIVHVLHEDAMKLEGKFDTILLMMNGWGMGKKIKGTLDLVKHLKTCLNPGGMILGDTSDLVYMFPNKKGQPQPSLESNNYYGELHFEIKWAHQKNTFNWIYPDPNLLELIANEVGLAFTLHAEGEHYDYLVSMQLI